MSERPGIAAIRRGPEHVECWVCGTSVPMLDTVYDIGRGPLCRACNHPNRTRFRLDTYRERNTP